MRAWTAAFAIALMATSCTAPDDAAGRRVAEPVSIPFGELPSVVVRHGEFMYALDRRQDSIAKIDPSSNEVVEVEEFSDVFEREASLWDLDAAGDFVWVTAPGGRSIIQLDPVSLEIAMEIATRGHVSDVHVAAGSLWFAVSRGKVVYVVRMNASTGERQARFRLGPINTHIGGVVEFDGSVWLVRDRARHVQGTGENPTFEVSAELWRIDRSTTKVLGRRSLGSTFTRGAVNPVIGDIEVAEDGIWMSRVNERRLVLVDPSTGELLMQFIVGIFEHPWEFEIIDGGLWVGELNGPHVVHIDIGSRDRRIVGLDAETSYLGSGFGSLWVPLGGAPPDGGQIVRLDPFHASE